LTVDIKKNLFSTPVSFWMTDDRLGVFETDQPSFSDPPAPLFLCLSLLRNGRKIRIGKGGSETGGRGGRLVRLGSSGEGWGKGEVRVR
jgi:hypothetical protein